MGQDLTKHLLERLRLTDAAVRWLKADIDSGAVGAAEAARALAALLRAEAELRDELRLHGANAPRAKPLEYQTREALPVEGGRWPIPGG